MKQVWTIARLIRWTTTYFQERGIESPRLDTEVLLAHVLQKDRIYLYVHFEEPLEAKELATFHELVRRRGMREPVAYLTGQREFMGLNFQVTPAVLIPRPDTEILVEAALTRLQKIEAPIIADIGTGSGAIALSVLAHRTEAKAVATDISTEALTVAKRNAESLKVAERVTFRQGDLCAPLAGQIFDAILVNPPYIAESERQSLQPEVRDYEPARALFAEHEGMAFYERLLDETGNFLQAQGFLAVEAGIGQARKIQSLVTNLWQRVEILKDYTGKERVVVLWKKGI